MERENSGGYWTQYIGHIVLTSFRLSESRSLQGVAALERGGRDWRGRLEVIGVGTAWRDRSGVG